MKNLNKYQVAFLTVGLIATCAHLYMAQVRGGGYWYLLALSTVLTAISLMHLVKDSESKSVPLAVLGQSLALVLLFVAIAKDEKAIWPGIFTGNAFLLILLIALFAISKSQSTLKSDSGQPPNEPGGLV